MIIAVLIALFLFFIVIPFGFYVLAKVGDALIGIIGLAIIGGLVYWAYTLVSGFYIAHVTTILLVGKILIGLVMLGVGLWVIYSVKLWRLRQKILIGFIGKYGNHLIKNVKHVETNKLGERGEKVYNKNTTYCTSTGVVVDSTNDSIWVSFNRDFYTKPYADQYKVPTDTYEKIPCIGIFNVLWSMRTLKLNIVVKPWKPIMVNDVFTNKTIDVPVTRCFFGSSLLTTIEATI